jgi:hypothetical protein
MPYQFITLITPEENITVNGKLINIRNIESVKIDQNGGLNFIEKQPLPPQKEPDKLTEPVG